MPVVRDQYTPPDVSRFTDVQSRLVAELRSPHPFGQPLILEEDFARTRLIGVTVVWDDFEPRSDLQRSTLILNAYEQVFGKEHKDRIGFAVGYTEPEAVESGLLPFTVSPHLRKSDPLELRDKCRAAMIELGASDLWKKGYPRLRLPTEELANRYFEELIRRVPGSEEVWAVVKDMHLPA